ncbi:surfactin synthase thioesterase subunit [Ruminiclostridium sufflavum DSM 19573]|uniref:Surfactin synthase thioesterase subunit n=1 Tax=Ruminiclostridium sufflavum DSM 19573 TaxID=1121337 RepID=A0A318XR58_9FIRM|nr:thioesterase domain-containing protein [Ruminiclostridium sufflavum]PYG89958.1 surfactin synthase thioesterase subunit [Ruminiclostridium sufflavum DSM 19573]
MNHIWLYAVPYAVGTANIYHPLERRVHNFVNVKPVELSGHGRRCDEQSYVTIQEMALDLLPQFQGKNKNEPYFLFGYSMGALVCLELCYLFQELNLQLPEHLFLFACDSPAAKRTDKDYANMSIGEIMEELLLMNDANAELLQNKDIMEFIYPIAKADFAAATAYMPKSAVKISCPATIVRGSDEELLDERIDAWQQYFSKEIDCEFFEGGHFFFFQNESLSHERFSLMLKKYTAYFQECVY